MKRKLFVWLFVFGFLTLMSGCKSCSNQSSNQDVNVEVDQDVIEDINQAKKIFYSLPSPLETAMLIKTAGATYNEKLLNPLSNQSGYTTNKSMALNLGIYTTVPTNRLPRPERTHEKLATTSRTVSMSPGKNRLRKFDVLPS